MRLIVYCKKHSEYGVEEAPRQECKTCELLYVMYCRDDEYASGADEDFVSYCNRVGEAGLVEAFKGLETSAFGTM